MSEHSRLIRLITLALASCAVTWALAGSALARPDTQSDTGTANAAPAFKVVVGDANKAPAADQAPAFKVVNADANKTPDRAHVQRVINGLATRGDQPAATAPSDDTGTVALIIAIAAILTALGAMTLTITRTHRPMLGA